MTRLVQRTETPNIGFVVRLNLPAVSATHFYALEIYRTDLQAIETDVPRETIPNHKTDGARMANQ